jgi:trimeric autotransporter adhesin
MVAINSPLSRLAPLCLIGVLCAFSTAQTAPPSRITQPVNDGLRVTLKGNVHPLAQARFDLGAVADSFPASRMLLLLQRSPEREAALEQFLEAAHRPGSASFHKWLKPEQFGQFYGPADSEVAVVSGWLQQHGFSINRVNPAKTAIEFSGTASEVRSAFHTQIHAYVIHGEQHYANDVDPEIPAALAPVIAGITPMNNFRPRSDLKMVGKGLYDPRTHRFTPEWTWNGNPPVLALGPGDFAVQYDLNPLYNTGLTGTGITIGIIGASDIDPTAVVNYHAMFGLPAPNFTVVIDGEDTNPNEGNWATGESYLDVEVSSSIAPGAMVNLYTAADTTVQSGLLLAAARAVDDDQAPVLSTSYAECESELGTAGNQFWAGLWEQAAAQGQTSFVAAGDNGSAGCDDFGTGEPAQKGLAVSGFTSTPWNVSVGGTDFYYSTYNGTASAQLAQIGNYWNLNATSQPAVSLMQPVPEQPWNEAFGLNLDDAGVYDPSRNGATIVAGSGGASSVYPKPAWQSGKGVPADHARDLPDVSLFASDGVNDTFWLVCGGSGGCTELPDLIPPYEVSAVGGTSASSPAMAAIMAIVDQKYGPQGQVNFILYPLATQHPSGFHDIAMGSNDVPCVPNSADCTLSAASDNTNGFDTLGHYYATSGYDQATGLGSVDANLLVQNWNSLTFKSSSTALTVSEPSFTHGTPVTVGVTVSGSGGTPTGNVGLVTNATPASNTGLGEVTLNGGTASTTLDSLPGGQYQLTAKYTGDTIFAPSNASLELNVQSENSTVSLTGNYWSSSTSAFAALASGGSYPYGTYIVLDAQPRGVNAPAGKLDGWATGSVAFTDPVGSSTVNSGPVNINRLGIAEWQPATALPVGNNTVTATYPGDSSFNASSSNPALGFTISKAQTTANLSASPSAIAVGSATTLSLLVAVPYSAPDCAEDGGCTFLLPFVPPPTGSVTFSLGNTQLGTAPLVPNTGASGYAWATLNVSSLPLGKDAVTASYTGDANYGAAMSSFNVTVGQVSTLTATANPSAVNQAEYTIITATVSGVSGMPTPTGTISYFMAGPGSDWSDTETLSNGSARSAPVPGGIPNPGTASVQVSYSGDSTYGPGSAAATFTVTAGTTLPFSLSGTALTIAAGATSGNFSTVSVTPQGGFTGNVYLSCSLTSFPVAATHLPTCSIPASVDITGAEAATAAMTISSTAPTTIHASALPPDPRLWIRASAGLVLVGFFLVGTLRQRRDWGRASTCLLLLAVFGIFAGCGGGGNNGGGGTQTIPGTTPGNYVFTVNGAFSANGVNQVQGTVNVTIQ